MSSARPPEPRAGGGPGGRSLARPRRLTEGVTRAGELYARARGALERGAWPEAAATLAQAGQWLAAWEADRAGSPERAAARDRQAAVAAARDELGHLRCRLRARLAEIGAERDRLRERRRTLRRFGPRSAPAGRWLDQRG